MAAVNKEQLAQVLKEVESLSKDSTDTVSKDKLKSELVDEQSFSEEEFSESVAALKDLGKLFEPVEGHLEAI